MVSASLEFSVVKYGVDRYFSTSRSRSRPLRPRVHVRDIVYRHMSQFPLAHRTPSRRPRCRAAHRCTALGQRDAPEWHAVPARATDAPESGISESHFARSVRARPADRHWRRSREAEVGSLVERNGTEVARATTRPFA